MDKSKTAASLFLMLDEADRKKAIEQFLRQLAESSTKTK